LISVGAYQQGSDPAIDRAIRMHPQLIDFITQNMNHSVSFDSSRTQLAEVLINTVDDDQPVAVDAPVDVPVDAPVDQPLSGELVG
jgi:predicted RecB family nuclease